MDRDASSLASCAGVRFLSFRSLSKGSTNVAAAFFETRVVLLVGGSSNGSGFKLPCPVKGTWSSGFVDWVVFLRLGGMLNCPSSTTAGSSSTLQAEFWSKPKT